MSQLIPEHVGLLLRWFIAFGLLTTRYLLFAGLAYLLFYVVKRREWLFMKIQQKYPENKQVLTEIKYSFLTFLVFSSVVVAIRFVVINHILETKVYKNFADHSVLYYVLTTIFLIAYHNTYFYFAHRLMHKPWMFKHVHAIHHLSKDPTPWAAFAFHPLEALVEIAFVPMIIFTVPLHFTSLLIVSMWMIVFNVMGHLGFELFPKGFIRNNFVNWVNTSTNHNMHHKFITSNYGLYFNVWDKIFKTNHAKYESTFEEVTTRRDEGFKKLRDKSNAEEEEAEMEVEMA